MKKVLFFISLINVFALFCNDESNVLVTQEVEIVEPAIINPLLIKPETETAVLTEELVA